MNKSSKKKYSKSEYNKNKSSKKKNGKNNIKINNAASLNNLMQTKFKKPKIKRKKKRTTTLKKLIGGAEPNNKSNNLGNAGNLENLGNLNNLGDFGNAGNAGNSGNAGNAGNAGNSGNAGNAGNQSKNSIDKPYNEFNKSMNNEFNKLTPENAKNINNRILQKDKNDSKNKKKNNLTYYEKLDLKDKITLKNAEGLYFIGVDIGSFLEKLAASFSKKNKNATPEDIKTINSIGEYVDEDYNKIVTDLLGYRDIELDRSIKPEYALNNLASFNNIITESKQYTVSNIKDKVTPNGLLKLTKVLSKYKKSESQWLRVASLLEIMYSYLSKNEGRDSFFNSKIPISIDVLREIEEFWATEHIFMTYEGLQRFKSKLSFYKDT